MSGLLGIWNRLGEPVERSLLERLAEPMTHRGPDGNGFWTAGSVGLGSLLMRVTPESADETQPTVGVTGSALVWDGRLDNRVELQSLLGGARRQLHTGASDPAVVLATYEELGTNFVARLLGDFALAVFDPRSQQLILARDSFGVRPLSYWVSPSLVIFASEIKSLLSHPQVNTNPDEDTIAEMLLNGWPQPNRGTTFFRGVRDVLPSQVVQVSELGVRARRYWDIDPEKRIRLSSFDEYAEAFRAVFEKAVHRRMRAMTPIAVTVSGGLDSSSIATVATSLRRAHPGLPELFGVHRLAQEGTGAYELEFVRDVEKLSGIDVEMVPFDVGASAISGAWITEAPDFDPFDRMYETQAKILRARGTRVLLVGMLGDELLGDTAYLVDLARRMRWATVRRQLDEITTWTQDAGDYYRREFWHALRRSLVPSVALPSLRRAKSIISDPLRAEPWWMHDLRARSRRSAQVARPEVRFHTKSASSIYGPLYDKRSLLARQQRSKLAAFYGYEEPMPYLDRDLVSFLLAIPGEVLSWGGVHRALLRAAMRDALPRSVTARVAKGEYGDLYNLGLRQRAVSFGSTVPEWQSVRRGYVEGRAVEEALADRSAFATTRLHSIRRVLELEWWLRAYFPE